MRLAVCSQAEPGVMMMMMMATAAAAAGLAGGNIAWSGMMHREATRRTPEQIGLRSLSRSHQYSPNSAGKCSASEPGAPARRVIRARMRGDVFAAGTSELFASLGRAETLLTVRRSAAWCLSLLRGSSRYGQ